MKVKRANKYQGLKQRGAVPFENAEVPLRLAFEIKGGRKQIIDFNFFLEGHFPRTQMARVFSHYFWQTLQPMASHTREGQYAGLRTFNDFLNWKATRSVNIESTLDITSLTLSEFQTWLIDVREVSKVSAHNYYRQLMRVLTYLMTHKPEHLSPHLIIPRNIFLSARGTPRKVPSISITDLLNIANAAAGEVAEIRRNHSLALKLLEEGIESPAHFGSGKYPSRHLNSLANILVYIVKQCGLGSRIPRPLRHLTCRFNLPTPTAILNMYVPITERNLIPFLVLLHIRSAINVEALHNLKRDCLKEHPLPLGATILEFNKPRSGTARFKSLIFPTKQEGGVVDLIKFLLQYTAPLAPLAHPSESNDLFLYKLVGERSMGGAIRSAISDHSKGELKNFIARNNLPDFSLAQIRHTVATLIYLQTRNIFRVQRLLCHTSVFTTINYVRQEVTRLQHDIQMRDGIASMVKSILGDYSPTFEANVFAAPMPEVLKEKTSQGEISKQQAELIGNGSCSTGIARCRDPWDSPLPGEKKGRMCKQLHMCIFCPNAWIFEEDLPKIIYYRDSLLADRVNFSDSTWDALHGEAYRAIVEEILSSFSLSAIAEATKQARETFTPYPITAEHYES